MEIVQNTQPDILQLISDAIYQINAVHEGGKIIYTLRVDGPSLVQNDKFTTNDTGSFHYRISIKNNDTGKYVIVEDVIVPKTEQHLLEISVLQCQIRFFKNIIISGIYKCNETMPIKSPVHTNGYILPPKQTPHQHPNQEEETPKDYYVHIPPIVY